MKYYFNFICQPNDGANGRFTSNNEYTFPTDPMYKQDGVYNQRCKYKITNFAIQDLIVGEVNLLRGRTLVVRFNNLTCMNSFTLTSFGGNGKYQQTGQNPVEFHIRLGEEMVASRGNTGQVVQNLAGLDTIGITNKEGTFDDEIEAGTKVTFPASQSRRNQVGNATLTTLAVPGDDFVYNTALINSNSFDEELIGMPCWGQEVDLSFLRYGSTEDATQLIGNANTQDINIVFTLEVEPIAVKL